MSTKVLPRRPKKKGSVARFSASRVCKKYGCKQRLSVYNSAVYCHVHRPEFLD